jgi:twitching motility protein PilT
MLTWLEALVAAKGSDLHLKVGSPPRMRVDGRLDPDVILVEIRDAETLKTSLAAAETGHLVLSTLHTADAAETVNRCIDLFPPYQQRQVRLSLATALRGIVGQRLVRRAGDAGRVAVLEVMVNTGRTAEAIADPDRTGDLILQPDFVMFMAEGGLLLGAGSAV